MVWEIDGDVENSPTTAGRGFSESTFCDGRNYIVAVIAYPVKPKCGARNWLKRRMQAFLKSRDSWRIMAREIREFVSRTMSRILESRRATADSLHRSLPMRFSVHIPDT